MYVSVTTEKGPILMAGASRWWALFAGLFVCLAATAVRAAPEGEAWATSSVQAQPVQAQPAPGQPVQAQPAPVAPTQQPTAEEVNDADPEALTLWRPQLEPYGAWVDDPRYGVIWVPRRDVVGANFSPYVTSGHWALDEDNNWIWVSDHPFGWVVFHYGRWFYSTEYGWAWVPGRTYAPNWVVWRLPSAEYAYVGWAPMPPRFGWFSGGVVWYSSYGAVSYVFCPSEYVFYPGVGVYIVHDPWLVGQLGIYTTFYYPPYYAYGGYYGYPHHHHHVDYGRERPPAYGPPMNRARIPQRAIPRSRVAADPRAVAAARPSGSSRIQSSAAVFRSSDASSGARSARPAGSERDASPRATQERSGRDAPAARAPAGADSPRAASPSRGFSPRGGTVRSQTPTHIPGGASPRRSSSPGPARKRR